MMLFTGFRPTNVPKLLNIPGECPFSLPDNSGESSEPGNTGEVVLEPGYTSLGGSTLPRTTSLYRRGATVFKSS